MASLAFLAVTLFAATQAVAQAAPPVALPPGFFATQVASGLQSPTAMAFAPDGRIFVCTQGGQVRVIKDGELLPAPFVSLDVDQRGERGLLGIAFDPDFKDNGFLYLYYTVNTSPAHNRISRFTARGDAAAPGSEVLILRLDDLSGAFIHNGGALHFGPDGKLYVAVGENSAQAGGGPQSLNSFSGKILRLNRDGTFPSDNPFFNTAGREGRAVWALGLRNPFTFAIQPETGRTFINDVGADVWEEINEGAAAANYGWPLSEGPTSDPAQTGPFFRYPHGIGPEVGCAITGGAFYNPRVTQFPSEFVGKYFFADFCGGWIRVLDPVSRTASGFATELVSPVDLQVGPDGELFYLDRAGDLNAIGYAPNAKPRITRQPSGQTVTVGNAASFSVKASGAEPLTYQWQRNGADIPGANSPTYTLDAVRFADDGVRFRCLVSNVGGTAASEEAVLSVTSNRGPTATITSPSEGALYRGGETISFAGAGADPEEGQLPPGAFTWRVDFHHGRHSHPFLPPTAGMANGSFVVPTTGETSSDVWYRIHLTVVDSGGFTHATFRDVLPRKSAVTLAANVPGLQLTLDGRPATLPLTFTGVVGVRRVIGAISPQTLGAAAYRFESWSDGGAATHEISTPETDTTYTANFSPIPSPSALQFTQPSYRVREDAGHLQLTVTRSGDASSGASVDYETVSGTAADRSDYTAARGTLRFAPGEVSKSFAVLLSRDAFREEDETFRVVISNPTGGAVLGGTADASVTLADVAYGGGGNPVDETAFFVRQHYLDFLNREPDASGLEFWSNVIESCGADLQCREVNRINVSAAFFLSIEFQETGYFAYLLYAASFARQPRMTELFADAREVARGVVVRQGDWQTQLEVSKREFADAWVERPAFRAAYDGLSNSEYVHGIFNTAGITPRPSEREAIAAQLDSGVKTRADVLLDVANDARLRRKEANRAFVLMEYLGYLRRNPTDPPDDDLEGYNFWLGNLEKFNGNFVHAELVKAFITSIEYRQRFGP